MPARRTSISASEARRIALAAQGFDRSRPTSPNDVRHFRRVLQAVGVLQLDFVNVLLPAQFLILWSRLGAYDRQKCERFLYDSREFTEQWAHEASIVRASDWPLLEYRRRAWQPWKRNPLRTLPDPEGYLREILEQVRSDGAVTANDVPAAAGPKRKPGEWHRPVQRWALEHHFGRGMLGVRRRLSNFQRVYDLPERLIDAEHREAAVSEHEARRTLLRQSAASLGVATLQDLADYYRMSPRDTAPRLQELVDEGALTPVRVEGWCDQGYLWSGASIPREITGASLLSPFDPVVWYRPRAQRIFDFEYRIEIYVPAAKRRWGYYVLPFRVGDRIVARVDLKADRKAGRLLVPNLHFEPDVDRAATSDALRAELEALATWLGLDGVERVLDPVGSR
ncbi:MAG: crosslink repair DNA glycosylase YcaQ family protein [Woeseiaceae bacterium]|nr:crosslink repair DNA glycosylase YcaQ family protein [Woeseiaceae bacterium]